MKTPQRKTHKNMTSEEILDKLAGAPPKTALSPLYKPAPTVPKAPKQNLHEIYANKPIVKK